MAAGGRERRRKGLAANLEDSTKRFAFTQKSGSRKGQHFNVVTGRSGLDVRKYASGQTAIAEADSGVDIKAQRRDRAGTPAAPKAKALPGPKVNPAPERTISQERQLAGLAKKYAASLKTSSVNVGRDGKTRKRRMKLSPGPVTRRTSAY